jgi:hypothetical protein
MLPGKSFAAGSTAHVSCISTGRVLRFCTALNCGNPVEIFLEAPQPLGLEGRRPRCSNDEAAVKHFESNSERIALVFLDVLVPKLPRPECLVKDTQSETRATRTIYDGLYQGADAFGMG